MYLVYYAEGVSILWARKRMLLVDFNSASVLESGMWMKQNGPPGRARHKQSSQMLENGFHLWKILIRWSYKLAILFAHRFLCRFFSPGSKACLDHEHKIITRMRAHGMLLAQRSCLRHRIDISVMRKDIGCGQNESRINKKK